MVLIIGGIGQGKLAFAKEHFGVETVLDGQFGEADCIINLQNMVLKEHFSEDLENFLQKKKDAVIICNEVGCGVVPMDAKDRVYREMVGRVCVMLAKQAEEVYRVFCGIGTKIK